MYTYTCAVHLHVVGTNARICKELSDRVERWLSTMPSGSVSEWVSASSVFAYLLSSEWDLHTIVGKKEHRDSTQTGVTTSLDTNGTDVVWLRYQRLLAARARAPISDEGHKSGND